MNQRSGGKIDLDTDPASGGGNLIHNGTWNLLGEAKISSTHFKGRFINAGVLQTVDAGGAAIMISDFDSRNGSEIRTAAGSSLTLLGASSFKSGAILHSDGELRLSFGEHHLWGADLEGDGYLKVGSSGLTFGGLGPVSKLTLHGSIGLAEGPAKGGFFLDGGVLQGTPPILGFGGQAGDFLAAERGKFGNDMINGVTVRLTGESEKLASSELKLVESTLLSEGTFQHAEGGIIDLDSLVDSPNSGTIINRGIWNLASLANVKSTHCKGLFKNEGELDLVSGFATISSPLSNKPGAAIRIPKDSFLWLERSSFHRLGSLLALEGTLSFRGGRHVLHTGRAEVEDTIFFNGSSPQFEGPSATLGGSGWVYGRVILADGAVLAPSDAIIDSAFQGAQYQFAVTYDSARKFIELEATGMSDPYGEGVADQGLTPAQSGFTADPDGDGIENGMEFVRGGDPLTPSFGILPGVLTDGEDLVFTFRQSSAAAHLIPAVQYGGDLADWNQALHQVNGVTITTTADGFGPGLDKVETRLPRSLVHGKIFFVRLVVP